MRWDELSVGARLLDDAHVSSGERLAMPFLEETPLDLAASCDVIALSMEDWSDQDCLRFVHRAPSAALGALARRESPLLSLAFEAVSPHMSEEEVRRLAREIGEHVITTRGHKAMCGRDEVRPHSHARTGTD